MVAALGSSAGSESDGGAPCVAVWARDRRAAEAAAALGSATALPDLADLWSCETILIAVTDAALGDVAEALRDADVIRCGAAQTVLHTGGAFTGEDALAPLRETGAVLGSLHPLVAVPRGETVPSDVFRGVPFAVEATESSGRAVAASLVEALGGFEITLPAGGDAEEGRATKARYHALATMVATGVVTLVEQAASALAEPGTQDDFRQAYAALALSAARNVGAASGSEVLTGAVARDDDALIALHREALRGSSETLGLYAAVESAARQMLARAGGEQKGERG